MHLTRLHPLGLKVYPKQLQAEDKEAKEEGRLTAVFFGDSRAYDWPNPSAEQIQEDYYFVNRAIGGQTSIQVIERYDAHVRYLEPDFLILQVGINDITAVPLFPQHADDIVRSVQKNIQTIVEKATTDGTTIILTTISPVGQMPPERMLFWSQDGQQAIVETNEFIHSLAGEQVIVLDTYELLADDKELLNSAYRRDELHLNEAGYKHLNMALFEMLKEPIQ